MASGRIKGITIEIDGDTTKLTTALKQVDKQIRDTQSSLRDVNKLLKQFGEMRKMMKKMKKMQKGKKGFPGLGALGGLGGFPKMPFMH